MPYQKFPVIVGQDFCLIFLVFQQERNVVPETNDSDRTLFSRLWLDQWIVMFLYLFVCEYLVRQWCLITRSCTWHQLLTFLLFIWTLWHLWIRFNLFNKLPSIFQVIALLICIFSTLFLCLIGLGRLILSNLAWRVIFLMVLNVYKTVKF